VALRDDDAGETLPAITLTNDLELATRKAKEFAGI
jgi:hypothetical protein